jgi:hypothetical protein
MKGNGFSPLVRVDRGGEQRESARKVEASSEAKKKGDNSQTPIRSREHKREKGCDENDEPEGNGLLEANPGSDPVRDQEGARVADGKEKKDAAGQGMADVKLLFENRKQGRENRSRGEIEEPEAPEEEKEKDVHEGGSTYVLPFEAFSWCQRRRFFLMW